MSGKKKTDDFPNTTQAKTFKLPTSFKLDSLPLKSISREKREVKWEDDRCLLENESPKESIISGSLHNQQP